MCVSEDMINRFLNGYASESEKAVVREFFLQHPQALEKYLTEESWSGFQPADQLTPADSEKMLLVIEELTYRRRKTRGTMWFRLAGAAILLLAVGAGLLWLRNKPVNDAPQIVAGDGPVMEEKVNRTTGIMNVTLPDQTIAALQPGASLRYRQPFGKEVRDVHLEGQALFTVKSNAGKPFTVYAGGLGTTALGTVFNVDAGSGRVVVQLVSGKVVVRSAAANNKPVYLKPGEKLYYDDMQRTVSVEQPKRKEPVEKAAAIPGKTLPPAAVLLQFENEPLTAMFKTIEMQYGMQARYEPGTLDNMYFTGVYDSGKESLPDFLNTIALLNNVTIRIDQKTIYITP